MVILNTDGEKYACENCIKGHRVTSCQHSDRVLHHVNKKGRPVSQCTHCRGLRKSRSSHARCSCGDPGHGKDHHAEKHGHEEDHSCACQSGGKCQCSLKKEPSDNLLSVHRRTQSKPNISTRRSEGAIHTKPRNTLHPPMHRLNTAAHDVSPYTIPKHGTANGSLNPLYQRSVDSLPLNTHSSIYQTSVSMPRFDMSPLEMDRDAKSEHGNSPTIPDSANESCTLQPNGNNSFMNSTAVPPAFQQRWSVPDFSRVQYPPNADYFNCADMASSATTEQTTFPWSEWDFSRPVANPNPSRHNFQAPSIESVEYSLSSQPGLSRSESRTTSEPGETTNICPNTAYNFNGLQRFDPIWTNGGYGNPDPNRLSTSSFQAVPRDIAIPPNEQSMPVLENFAEDYIALTGGNGKLTSFPNESIASSTPDVKMPSNHEPYSSTATTFDNVDPEWDPYFDAPNPDEQYNFATLPNPQQPPHVPTNTMDNYNWI